MEFRKLGIIGGGSMGKSIAHKVASNGIDVVVLEVSAERVERARAELAESLDQELAKWGITAGEKKAILSRVHVTADLKEIADTDLVIETVTEDIETKKRVMKSVCDVCLPDRIFVTNSSTLSITEIAAASGCLERVVGMHFMYPVTRSPIVEASRAPSFSFISA